MIDSRKRKGGGAGHRSKSVSGAYPQYDDD